ncbi:MAG: tRNA lysidine(34) synthetase TilS [Bacteroidaceae bacterium]|nr:tRNA lysidine(34) synthetase TilS [Bacteroidaceae bacterium]
MKLKPYFPSPHLLLALSGGADSVALLLMLLEQGIHPVAAHCNFHLRGKESQRDEDFVRQLCQERGVELHVQHFDTLKECQRTGESIEMAARRLRYTWFEELRQQQGLDYICTAHHKDDQAETLLLNLVRGAGLAGLRGMQPIQGRICRPLLDLYTRNELQAYLHQHEQAWVEDSSNADTHYQRNLVRHELLPLLIRLNQQAINHITETTRHLRETEQLLSSTQENWEEEHCIILPDGLRIPFSSNTKVGAELHTDGPLMVTRTASGIEVRQRPQQVAPRPIQPHLTQSREHLRDKRYALVDAARVTPPFILRSLEAGDRFQPFGMQGTRLVSDYLTDRHRSRIDKLAQLVVCDKEGIIWLCGETISQRVALTSQTTEILEFRSEDLVIP